MIPYSPPEEEAPIAHRDSPLQSALTLIKAVAGKATTVFLQGESGTGKEVLAHYLHRLSPRKNHAFVAVNCAAIAPTLLEAELFGVKKGAYTGASQDRLGRIRQAQGGTLFLDEIGDMPLEAQTRLLRVLQEKKVGPIGCDEEYPVDFRLVCATHRDLRREVAAGKFREDLFYRLHVFAVTIPPLRERRQDIPLLLTHFLQAWLSAEEAAKALLSFPDSLREYAFPGNVRELRNMAERFAVLSSLGQGWDAGMQTGFRGHPAVKSISPEGLPSHAAGALPNSRISDHRLLQALEACGWHRENTAKSLGICRRTLQYRIARWNRSQKVLYI